MRARQTGRRAPRIWLPHSRNRIRANIVREKDNGCLCLQSNGCHSICHWNLAAGRLEDRHVNAFLAKQALETPDRSVGWVYVISTFSAYKHFFTFLETAGQKTTG